MEVSISFPGALNHLSNSFIVNDKMYWKELLSDILKTKYKYLFDDDLPKDYILLYLNGVKIDKLNRIKPKNKDSLNILSAISGG
ncbi:TPA: MoaD/ThiS family protein [Legionella pneumophila]|nr:MoaD/ThiS family protein [Legionella pneumophila]